MNDRAARAGVVVLTAMLTMATAVPAGAQLPVEVTGESARVTVELPGGLAVDVSITFEEAIGLSAASLGISAQLVSVSAELLSRMPSQVSVPSAFPVMLTIEPPPDGPLSFRGVVTLELHTHDLEYTANTPLRLFAAQLGGPFRDITSTMGMGSYRVRGTKGGFSQFLILADLRDGDLVIDEKITRLQSLLDLHQTAIPPLVHQDLQEQLDAAWAAWTVSQDPAAARSAVEELAQLVRTHSGAGIPDVWRSSRDLVNVAGELRAAADTLRFALNARSSRTPAQP